MSKGTVSVTNRNGTTQRLETDEEYTARMERQRVAQEATQQLEQQKQQQQQRKQRLSSVRNELKDIALDPEDLGEVVDVLRTVVKQIKLLQLEIADLREPVISDLG